MRTTSIPTQQVMFIDCCLIWIHESNSPKRTTTRLQCRLVINHAGMVFNNKSFTAKSTMVKLLARPFGVTLQRTRRIKQAFMSRGGIPEFFDRRTMSVVTTLDRVGIVMEKQKWFLKLISTNISVIKRRRRILKTSQLGATTGRRSRSKVC